MEAVTLAVGVVAVTSGLFVGLRAAWRWVRRISHFLDDVNGQPARPGVPAQPGILEQVTDLRVRQEEIALVAVGVANRQEEIAVIAVKAADDAAAMRLELTRNGGESTKDAAFQSARSAEAAAMAAQVAAHTAERTEQLLRRHMENGLEIMEVGQHNDVQIVSAIEHLGGSVGDYRPFPAVDIGDNQKEKPNE